MVEKENDDWRDRSVRLAPGSTFSLYLYHLDMDENRYDRESWKFYGESPDGNGPIRAKIIRQCLREYVEMYEKRVLHEKPVAAMGTHRASA